jgi:hypothetical protein
MSGAQGGYLNPGWGGQELMYQTPNRGITFGSGGFGGGTFTFGAPNQQPFNWQDDREMLEYNAPQRGIKGKDWDTPELRKPLELGSNRVVGNLFGLGGASAPDIPEKTRCLFVIPITNTPYQLNKPLTIIGYRIKNLSWCPLHVPAFDTSTGFIVLTCAQLANVNSTWGANRTSAIGSWNLSPVSNAGPSFVSEERDYYLNQPTELSRMDFILYDGVGSPTALVTNNAVNLVIEFILPN